MVPLGPLSLLPGLKHRIAAVVDEQYRAIVLGHEILDADLSPVEKRERQPVGQRQSSARLGHPGQSRCRKPTAGSSPTLSAALQQSWTSSV
jgi:hypothetical protein